MPARRRPGSESRGAKCSLGIFQFGESAVVAVFHDEPLRLRQIVLHRFPRIRRDILRLLLLPFTFFLLPSERPGPVQATVAAVAGEAGGESVHAPGVRRVVVALADEDGWGAHGWMGSAGRKGDFNRRFGFEISQIHAVGIEFSFQLYPLTFELRRHRIPLVFHRTRSYKLRRFPGRARRNYRTVKRSPDSQFQI